jgi:hypothetical protein
MLRAGLLVAMVAVPAAAMAQDNSAQLVVATTPSGAQVSVDGQAMGTAPVTARGLLPGSHIVEAHWPDGGAASAMASVNAGMSKLVALSPGMKPAATPEPARPAAPAPAATATTTTTTAPASPATAPTAAAPSAGEPASASMATSPGTSRTAPASAAALERRHHLRTVGMALTFTGAGLVVLGAIFTGVSYVPPRIDQIGENVSSFEAQHDALLGIGITFMIGGAGIATWGAIDWSRAGQ